MTERDELPFLSRWSRRKIETKEAQEIAAAAPAAPQAPVPATDGTPASAEGDARASTGAAPAAAAPLPSLDSLQGIASEYREFLKPGVDETLKRAALKKLFNDPHFGFAAMDKLDIYIDDYSIEDPIPEALLRTLNQSKSLFLFEEKKEEGESALQSDNGALADVVSAPELLDVPAGSAEAADTAGSGMAEIPMPGQGIKGAPKTV